MDAPDSRRARRPSSWLPNGSCPEKYKGYSSQVSTMMGGLAGRFQLLQKEIQ